MHRQISISFIRENRDNDLEFLENMEFKELKLDPRILDAIEKAGLTVATPIQEILTAGPAKTVQTGPSGKRSSDPHPDADSRIGHADRD